MNFIRRYVMTVTILLLAVMGMTAQPHYKIIDYEKLNNQVTIVNRIVRHDVAVCSTHP